MAKARKDNKGRALRKGESQRTEDMRYMYTYTDPYGKRRYIYANDLRTLRETAYLMNFSYSLSESRIVIDFNLGDSFLGLPIFAIYMHLHS